MPRHRVAALLGLPQLRQLEVFHELGENVTSAEWLKTKKVRWFHLFISPECKGKALNPKFRDLTLH